MYKYVKIYPYIVSFYYGDYSTNFTNAIYCNHSKSCSTKQLKIPLRHLCEVIPRTLTTH